MNSEGIVAQLENKVGECFQEVQEQLDLSFTRIDAYLDQLSVDSYPTVIHNTLTFTPPVAQISLPSIQTLINQLIQQLKPIINLTIHQQIQSNQQQHSIINNHHQLNLKSFTYQLLQNHSIQQSEYCYAIAINKDNSIILAGCGNKIRVFEFKQEQLKQIQILSEHSGYDVITLNFMKKQNQFISADSGGQIIIWSMNENSQWICTQKLNEHSYCINCLVMNNNEDLFISGSDDKTIKFWLKQNQWVCSQTITDHSSNVCGLSLNEQQNRLISCGRDNLILIIERSSQDQQWNVKQKISVQVFGYRLCFINDNEFTFQPNAQEKMHVYEMNNSNQQFEKTKEIDVKRDPSNCYYHFPQQYIKQKCLLVNKNGKNINLIRKNQNADFITQQSIQFGHYHVFGQMSEDGNYLMTWDGKSNEIQIRKYHEQ